MISLVLFVALAQVDDPDAGVAAVDEPSDLERQLDAAAGFELDAGTVAPAANPVLRAFQSLNPDLAVIVDADLGVASAPAYSLSGDDPDLIGGSDEQPGGFTLQEIELALSATVDPFFRGDVFFTIPNLSGFEVEEAMLTSTSLPGGLQAKAGIFRSSLGRQNAQHLHAQDFTRRPLINEAYLGADGLRAPGLQVSWLLPAPFFAQLNVEAFSVGAPEALDHLATFGGGKRTDLTFAASLEAFGNFTDAFSVYAGANFASGRTPGFADGTYAGAATLLQGFDLYLKVKPPNVTGGYFSLAWQSEYFVRQVLNGGETVLDGGLYSQLVVQIDRRWFLGLREDVLGVPSSAVQPRISRTSFSVTFAASEFARLRLYAEREVTPDPTGLFFLGRETWGGYLQLEASLGAHGAHAF